MRFILAVTALAATALAAPQYGSTQPRYPWGRQQTQPVPQVVTIPRGSQQAVPLTNSKGQPVGAVTLGNNQALPTTVIVSGDGNSNVGYDDGYGNQEPSTIIVSGNGVDSTSITIT